MYGWLVPHSWRKSLSSSFIFYVAFWNPYCNQSISSIIDKTHHKVPGTAQFNWKRIKHWFDEGEMMFSFNKTASTEGKGEKLLSIKVRSLRMPLHFFLGLGVFYLYFLYCLGLISHFLSLQLHNIKESAVKRW